MFVVAVIRAFSSRLNVPKGVTAVAVYGATICSGCGVMGMSAGLVSAAAGASLFRPAYYFFLTVPAAIVLVVTLVRGRFVESAAVVAGAILAYPVPWQWLPKLMHDGSLRDVVQNFVSYAGLAVVILALFSAFQPKEAALFSLGTRRRATAAA
jgi:hypothetical protein